MVGLVEEAGSVEVDVGLEEGHGATLGYFPCFIQVGLATLRAGQWTGEGAEPRSG